MQPSFAIKRGDTSPGLLFALSPSTVNLIGASVQFQMRLRNGDTVIDAIADVESETPPVVAYSWQAGDTDVAGWYEAEFVVTYSDGAVETFPNSGFINVFVNRDITGAE